jgi:hypothetical protein
MPTSTELAWMLDASDHIRKERLENPEPVLPPDHPGFIECLTCHVGVRADLFHCPACGRET